MKRDGVQVMGLYLLLTFINVVIFAVELNYGTIKDACRREVADRIERANIELQRSEPLTSERIAAIKAQYRFDSVEGYIIDTERLIQDCVGERAWFNLEW